MEYIVDSEYVIDFIEDFQDLYYRTIGYNLSTDYSVVMAVVPKRPITVLPSLPRSVQALARKYNSALPIFDKTKAKEIRRVAREQAILFSCLREAYKKSIETEKHSLYFRFINRKFENKNIKLYRGGRHVLGIFIPFSNRKIDSLRKDALNIATEMALIYSAMPTSILRSHINIFQPYVIFDEEVSAFYKYFHFTHPRYGLKL